MQQYFQNKNLCKTDGPTKMPNFDEIEYCDVVYSGFRWDNRAVFDNKIFDNCVFSKMGLRKCKFSHMNFGHSVFIDCYFKEGVFSCCDFTGALFINCNFDEATFVCCEFQYVKFEKCYITYKAMRSNLPQRRHNQNRDLCRNLGLEALHAGDDENFRKYYFEEKKASEKYYLKKFCHTKTEAGGFYDKKYNIWDAISGFFHYILSKLNRFLWGYGEKLGRLVSNMLLVVIGYWIVYQNMSIEKSEEAIEWYDGLYISFSNFFTISPVDTYNFPDSWIYEFASVTEAGIGVILVGFFVAAVFRYINRRS